MSIGIETKYKGAWDEAARRVIARDGIFSGYIAASIAILAASSRAKSADDAALGQTLGLALPYLTFVAGGLVAHHDFVISRLNHYLRSFESDWHHKYLSHSVVAGLVFFTIPMLAMFAILATVGQHLSQSAQNIPPEAVILRTGAKFVGVAGFIFALSGRIFQFLPLARKLETASTAELRQ